LLIQAQTARNSRSWLQPTSGTPREPFGGPSPAPASRYGLAFDLPEDLAAEYEQFGFELARGNCGYPRTLPLPSAYVVDREGVIRWAFVDADYTRRAEPADILKAPPLSAETDTVASIRVVYDVVRAHNDRWIPCRCSSCPVLKDCAPGLAVVVPVVGGLAGVVLVLGVLGDEMRRPSGVPRGQLVARAMARRCVAWWTR
jgi:hypothetical protein